MVTIVLATVGVYTLHWKINIFRCFHNQGNEVLME